MPCIHCIMIILFTSYIHTQQIYDMLLAIYTPLRAIPSSHHTLVYSPLFSICLGCLVGIPFCVHNFVLVVWLVGWLFGISLCVYTLLWLVGWLFYHFVSAEVGFEASATLSSTSGYKMHLSIFYSISLKIQL